MCRQQLPPEDVPPAAQPRAPAHKSISQPHRCTVHSAAAPKPHPGVISMAAEGPSPAYTLHEPPAPLLHTDCAQHYSKGCAARLRQQCCNCSPSSPRFINCTEQCAGAMGQRGGHALWLAMKCPHCPQLNAAGCKQKFTLK